MKLVPVKVFKFQNYDGPDNGSTAPEMVRLTCKNHTDLRWSTKNPYQRSIHYLGVKQYVDYLDGKTQELEIPNELKAFLWSGCSCPFGDLLVIDEAE